MLWGDELVEERQKHAEMFGKLTKLIKKSSRRCDSAATSSSHCVKHEVMKLTHLTEKDDMEVYDIRKRNGLTN